jgi:predicted tellurium resistance membrane protein TerC
LYYVPETVRYRCWDRTRGELNDVAVVSINIKQFYPSSINNSPLTLLLGMHRSNLASMTSEKECSTANTMQFSSCCRRTSCRAGWASLAKNKQALKLLTCVLLVSGATGFAPNQAFPRVVTPTTPCPVLYGVTGSQIHFALAPRNEVRHRPLMRMSMTNTDEAAVKETEQSDGIAPPFSVTLEEDDYDYKESIKRTAAWVGAAALFGGCLVAFVGPTTGEEFFAGYLVEQSLSVDNLFVFLMLFEYFKVPLSAQDRVLNWGIYGAIVMRAVMIGLGAAALSQFKAILLVFASILIYSSAQFFIGGDEEEEDPSENTIVKFSRNLIDSTDKFDGKNFFTLEDGIRKATPLFICMVAVEISDIVFAVDSIPAVFGVTEVRMEETQLFETNGP